MCVSAFLTPVKKWKAQKRVPGAHGVKKNVVGSGTKEYYGQKNITDKRTLQQKTTITTSTI
jgi:hypothetical protein